MESIFKEKYGFMKWEGEDSLHYCHIYTIKAYQVYFFGIEDSGGGIDLDEEITRVIDHCMQKYKPTIENAFFLRWFTQYHNRGVEWLDVIWDEGIPIDWDFKYYCRYEENPFINFYKF